MIYDIFSNKEPIFSLNLFRGSVFEINRQTKKWIDEVSMKWTDRQSAKSVNATEMDNIFYGLILKCVICWHFVRQSISLRPPLFFYVTLSLSIHFIDTSSTYPISQLKYCEIAKTDLGLSCDIIFNVFVWYFVYFMFSVLLFPVF